jgi:hypothetical protein
MRHAAYLIQGKAGCLTRQFPALDQREHTRTCRIGLRARAEHGGRGTPSEDPGPVVVSICLSVVPTHGPRGFEDGMSQVTMLTAHLDPFVNIP